MLSSGVCFPCGSTTETVGCMICNPDQTCNTCLLGLELNSQNQCVAPVIYQYESKNLALYISLIVVLSLGCLVLIACLGYHCYQRKKNASMGGLYKLIEIA